MLYALAEQAMCKGNLNRGQAKTKGWQGQHTDKRKNKHYHRVLKDISIGWMAFILSLPMQFRVDNSFNEKSNNGLVRKTTYQRKAIKARLETNNRR